MSTTFPGLHARHTSLLQQVRAVRDRKQFVADAQLLFRDLRLAGRSEGDGNKRQRLQSYADYWGDFIAEATGEYFDTTLESDAIAATRPAGRDLLTLIYRSGRERTIPFLAPEQPTEPLVSRGELLQGLKRRLFTGDLALYGPPGIGKTILAVDLAHDEEVLARFPDGILWANLGRLGTTRALNAWALALGVPEYKIATMSSFEERQRAVRAAVGLRRMLLVVDELSKEAPALRLGGPDCAHLCTTRSIEAAVAFAPEGFTVVSEMTTGESLALLGKLAPEAVESDPGTARELVAHTGGAPLTVALTGKLLRASHGREPAQELRTLAARWGEESHEEDVPSLRDRSTLEEATPRSLRRAIGLIEEALDEEPRRMFRALSAFPPKPNSFSREAALVVSAAPAAALETLVAYGLLESTGTDRYTVYQPIADFAREKLADESVLERMVDFFLGYVEAHREDPDALDLELPNVRQALETASGRGMPAHLVQGTNALYHFLEARGLYDLARTLLARAREAAESLDDTSGLVTTLLNQGRVEERRGDYVRAEEYLDSGLARARPLGDRQTIADLLLTYGIVEDNLGHSSKARELLEEALHLVQDEGDSKRTGEIYSRLGVLARDQGDFEQAESYLQSGLDLARRLSDADLASDLLLHFSFLEGMRLNPAKAREHMEESMRLARQAGNRDRIAALLHARGVLARTSEDYRSAEEALQEGLALARELGRLWYVGIILVEQGEVCLKERKPDTAAAAFREALATASAAGILFIVALALYGLGRVAELRNDFVEARRQGHASFALLEAIGHIQAKGVKDWLAALPSEGPP